jgi:hypothetical protein
MRRTILGLFAAIAVTIASAVPALAWCGSLIEGGGAFAPCADTYPVYYFATCCGAGYERLPDPEAQYHSVHKAPPQYYYVNQGPTYSGPGNFAPYPVYEEGGVTALWPYHRRHVYLGHRRSYRPVLHSRY